MCDTFVYRRETSSGSIIRFGKNSDREPNEAHEVIFQKGRTFSQGERVRCTYIDIPQVEKTHDVILCKPVWMWGAEMGVNRHGLVIGNEALFTKGGAPKKPALTGMDLLRLALERSTSAAEAVECITGLLETYGQGGNCGFSHPFFYNNSFLIADRKETWILKTIGRDWAIKRFDGPVAISNGLTLHRDWDNASHGFSGVKDLAAEKSDPLITRFSMAAHRRACTLDGMQQLNPESPVTGIFKILRAHGDSTKWPDDSWTANTVCMHAGFGPVRINQTTGSLVVDLSNGRLDVWITGTSLPCLSLFRPVHFGDFTGDTVISSEDDWREREIFNRNAIFCSQDFVNEFQGLRDQLQERFARIPGGADDRQLTWFDQQCRRETDGFYRRWTEKAEDTPKAGGHLLLKSTWRKFNRKAKFHIDI